jgi:hypothetical protein
MRECLVLSSLQLTRPWESEEEEDVAQPWRTREGFLEVVTSKPSPM